MDFESSSKSSRLFAAACSRAGMTRFGYTDSSDEERDSDELDSEDDEFPVSPPPRQGSVGVNGWNRPPPYSPTSSIANVAPSHWDKAEQLSKARSWVRAPLPSR